MKAGRKKTPPKLVDPWYGVLAKVWGKYPLPAPKPIKETPEEALKTAWRHEL
jgi:hypothetical protein